ncbi:MAG TPA: phospholipase D-like domain-containing protein, partial [Burkholderiaceae bacterium]|nr:phospholipase D-like domain-containing protein [Burkholderiaceae bacterium]
MKPLPSRFVDGNRVRLLEGGEQFFPRLLEAIDGSRFRVHLETYLFADDAVGVRVVDALARAARRGVRVRVVVDGYGSADAAAGLVERQRADG